MTTDRPDLDPDSFVQMAMRNHPRATGLAPLVPASNVVEALKAFAPLAKDPTYLKKLTDAASDARGLLDELRGLDERVAGTLHVRFEKHRAALANLDEAQIRDHAQRQAAHDSREKALQQREQVLAAGEAALKEKEAKFRRKVTAFESAA